MAGMDATGEICTLGGVNADWLHTGVDENKVQPEREDAIFDAFNTIWDEARLSTWEGRKVRGFKVILDEENRKFAVEQIIL